MELKTVLAERRSIRIFRPEALKAETIQELLEAARLAPSGTNLQPWRFLAVTSEEKRKKLAECTFGVNFIAQAPLTMVCCADRSSLATRPERLRELALSGAFAGTSLENFSFSDYQEKVSRDEAANLAYLNINVAIAVEQMILRAVDLGLGSCWVMLFSQKKVRELLALPENLFILALVPFGYPDQQPLARPRMALEEIYLGEV
ncbi:MAG: nitroreductase family protein [Dethiobacter sp.]|jgi:nitroreductase|nr:nitroreductase family protein [Dethiobacter sp.]MBS3988871.1 nitroreductase family protein [Dethiobacter sp.]